MGNPATGGVAQYAFDDLDDFLANGDITPAEADYSHDNLVALGVKYMNYFWWAGQSSNTTGFCAGNYPLSYPDSSVAGLAIGQPSSLIPWTQPQHEAAAGTGYTSQVDGAINTAGRKGSLYGMYFYQGAAPANAAVDTTTLDTFSTIPEALGGTIIVDTGSVIPYENACCPQLMGTALLGWWEADRLAYQTIDTSSAATADTNPVYHWDSLQGSVSWVRQSADANRPLLKTSAVNGYPSLLFDGTSDRMVLASPLALGSAFTIGMVVKSNNVDGMILSNAANNTQVRFNTTFAGSFSLFYNGSQAASGIGTVTNSAWIILRIRYDGTNARVYQNGVEVASYIVGPAFTNNMALDMLGAFGNGGASNFFSGELAALAICNDDATDNQIQLIEAYWAGKYGISVTGTPSLPHKAHVDRMRVSRSLSIMCEPFDRRDITSLQGWFTNGAGGLSDWDRAADAIADASVYYTLATLVPTNDARVAVYIRNNAAPEVDTLAERIVLMQLYAALGYDIHFDFDGLTTAEIQTVITAFNIIVNPSDFAGGGQLNRRKRAAMIRRRRRENE